MPRPQATKIEVTEAQRAILERMVRQRHSSQGLVSRAQIILGAADEKSDAAVQAGGTLLWTI